MFLPRLPGMTALLTHLKRRRQEAARLAVLELLEATPMYRAPGHVLRDTLADAGLAMSGDDFAAELAWLAAASLVELHDGDGAQQCSVSIRAAGSDVVHGRLAVQGVRRPPPNV